LAPTELAFAKIKQAVLCAITRSSAALEAAIINAFELITASDAQGFSRIVATSPICHRLN